jgi:signal transduction histidine kinase/CheY-like chemotaxis protein
MPRIRRGRMMQSIRKHIAALARRHGPSKRHAELEHSVRARLFWTMTGFMGVLVTGYLLVHASAGRRLYAALLAAVLLAAGLTAALARRTGSYVWPLRLLCASVFVVLAWVALRQGPDLPAAAWWLSIIPFVLAGGGLHYLAIAAVAGFVAVVTALQFGWVDAAWAGAPEPVVEPWRHYAAVIGSELLALALILLSLRHRQEHAAELEAARAAAAEAAAAKARFVSSMSHEIRTPLNGVIGAAELLDSPRLSNTQRAQLLALQRQSAQTLLMLVNDVLDFAKLEAGKMQLEALPVDVRALLFETCELFSVQAYAKETEITCSWSPDLPRTIQADPLRLRQILHNLAGNAVKFTERGSVHLHGALEVQDPGDPPLADARPRLRLEVADTGPGLTPAQQRRLFQAFSQADESVPRRYGGTGLGLAISQELARLMGGGIELQSTPGHGSRFVLAVPVAAAEEDAPPGPPLPRADVLVAVAGDGLARHLKSLMRELQVEATCIDHLPAEPELAGCRLLLVDAPLLEGVALRPWAEAQRRAARRALVMTPLAADSLIGADADVELLYKPVRLESLQLLVGDLPAAARRRSVPEPIAWPGLRVLVAEDNPVNQVVVQALFAELGIEVTLAGDGLELLERLGEASYDVVFTDLHMPRLDGLEAVRRWRAIEAAQRSGERLPFVSMTATGIGEEDAAARQAGMDAALSKPFGIAQLRRCLVALRLRGRVGPARVDATGA